MRSSRSGGRWGSVRLLAALLSALAVTAGAPARGGPLESMAALAADSGAAGGVCALLHARDGELAAAFGKHGAFVVQALCMSPETLAAVRQGIRGGGGYGTVSADLLRGARLPYTDNLVNIAILHPDAVLAGDPPSMEEVLRVLAPLGTVYVGFPGATPGAWTAMAARALREAGAEEVRVAEADGAWVRGRKPWPAEIDEWTHYLHGADGNPVAEDTVVGPPEHYQWVTDPQWLRSHETDSSVGVVVTARGRLFAIVDEAPISLTGQHDLPDKWALVARDAFNGVLLWRVPIRRWGWREWKKSWFSARPGDIPLNIRKRLVAVGDRVYVTLGYKAPVSELDARTGELLRTFPETEPTGEILHAGDRLILTVLRPGGARVMAWDLAAGRVLWETAKTYRGTVTDYIRWKEAYGGIEPPALDPALNPATDGRAIALIDGTELVGVDAGSGAELWRADFPEAESDHSAGGMQAGENLWNGTMIVRDGVVVHASPGKLAAFASRDGKLLWEQPKRYIGHLWYEWKDVFVIDGLVWTWGEDLVSGEYQQGGKTMRSLYPTHVYGYDLRTGERRREVDLGTMFKANHHHRCYRNKATSRFILASRRGTEFVSLDGGRHTVHNWVRSTCHVGMMPANGLQYVPPHPCACYIDEKLSGFLALAPATPRRPDAPVLSQADALRRGPAYGSATGPAAVPGEWPTFRSDAMRTGSAETTVADEPKLLWTFAGGGRVSAPTVAAGKVFVASQDEHRVLCLDAARGELQWEFFAGARVDSPPTYHTGTVLFGSADGRVYCLRAGDGELVWSFRAAPADRLIGAFGQLESAWPVHGSVLVLDGVAYCAAGRTSQLDGGIRVYGLDAVTGEVRYGTRLEGPDYAEGDFDTNFNLPMGTLPDVMMSDGETIHMRSAAFAKDLTPVRAKPDLVARHGLLDDTYFKRTPWTYGGEYARLIVRDKENVFYVRQFDSLRGLDPTVFFTPGAQGYLLFAKNMQGEKRSWMGRVPVRIRAMALAGARLVTAGPPDVVPREDPLGSFEDRLGGVLCVMDTGTGNRLSEQKLPSSPVFNGIAVAAERVFLTLGNGSVCCFGSP
ncbi:MAG: PQQ-binding-like beta-propeller repeat protein [Lentisphaeria bacterium]|nr:PQQ-binding-like beta-propeller repeat protein [Lentisphaeria bacterium]